MIILMRSIQADAVPRFSTLGWLTSTASIMRFNEDVMIFCLANPCGCELVKTCSEDEPLEPESCDNQ
jgi:hypothetical protein